MTYIGYPERLFQSPSTLPPPDAGSSGNAFAGGLISFGVCAHPGHPYVISKFPDGWVWKVASASELSIGGERAAGIKTFGS